ncbi:MAG: beta-lactamase family protein, partial [Synergistaceae bacterium]|nr:beta-lactamase family protein [Synergistaceae bacterium]
MSCRMSGVIEIYGPRKRIRKAKEEGVATRRFFHSFFFKTLLLLSLTIFSEAAAEAAPSRAASARRTEGERREFASFIDGFFAGVQRDWRIPGMAFVAVGNGEVIYLKGYGLADIESGRPVLPEETLFRVGSVSTVVTAAALLQLAEKGRVSLDEDVNVYLRRWRLPSSFKDAVTLRCLLTHTGGFDGKKFEIEAPTSADEKNYASRLPKIMPARYAPPGVYYGYSSMGYSLIGAIIERYSRLNFASAIERHIFQPLDMKNSTFSPTNEQAKRLATGYDDKGHAVGYSYHYDMPAVAMSATASDMGRLMLAQLGEGALGRSRILPAMYSNSMLRRHFSPHPMIEGTGLAYREKFAGGLRTLQQSGNMPGYSSFLMLIPEKNFGLFLAANTSNIDFSNDLAETVIGRLFPLSRDTPANAAPGGRAIPKDVEGFYAHNRIARHSAEKVMNLFSDQLRVEASVEYVTVSHTSGGIPASRWIPSTGGVSPDIGAVDLFRRMDENGIHGDEYAFFQRDDA